MAEQDPGATGQPSRRLAAIMFTDLVGYSTLSHRDEALAIELLELHRGWVREILPLHGGREIETVGDAFLIEFAGALAAVECAVAIQRRFAEHNAASPPERRMELRIGVHAGDIEHKGDKVFGDGVNIASRIHGMAKPGGICVSEDVHHAVRNRRAFQFRSLGTPSLKNIETSFELFELTPSLNFAPPATDAVKVAPPASTSRRRWLPAAAAAAVVLSVLALGGTWLAKRTPHSDVPAIAVLPFANLSSDADSGFFTDGLHDTVIGHLSRVAGLKVISRTSVMKYRGEHSDLKQVAHDLGVTSILEGSVQRAGNKLRVVAQLIDAATDTHLWSNEYDRDLQDVFAVQADIAQQVASAVKVKLTSQEQASLQSIPTADQAAYDLYLKALMVQRAALPSPAQTKQAVAWLDEAIARDSRFALAYALRASANDSLDWLGYDTRPERREQVGRDAEAALALAPGLAEAHIAKAQALYHGSRSYEAAIQELEIARRLAPGNVYVYYWLGPIQRRQGRWDEAVATFEKAVSLDPLNPLVISEQGNTLEAMRRDAEAQVAYDRVVTLDASPGTRFLQVYNRFLMSGDADTLSRALAEPAHDDDFDCFFLVTRAQIAAATGRHDEAPGLVAGCKQDTVLMPYYNERMPRDYFMALAKWRKDRSRVPPEAASARAAMEQTLAAQPARYQLRMALALALVMQGEKQRALEEVERALATMPSSRDAWTAAILLQFAAEVHANVGEIDRAFAELKQSLERPGGVHVAEIKIDPELAPLRGDPRYQQLIAGWRPV